MNLIKWIFAALMVAQASAIANADMPATHGMVIFGKNAGYVSHLPMYHAPHNYQLIMKIKPQNLENSAALAGYEKWTALGEKLFTIAPQTMDLAKVIDGKISEFQAILYKGHFEKDGEPLGKILVKVEKILLANSLVPNTPVSDAYILFGGDGEYFGAYKIGGKPSYDTIVKVNQPQKSVADPLKGFCKRRVCPDIPELTWALVLDAELPQTVVVPVSQKPHENAFLGSLSGVHTQVLDVLYFDDIDLAH